MFSKVVRSLCRDRHGLNLIAGVIGVLTGVDYLLSESGPKPVRVAGASVRQKAASAPAQPRLKISQTRSELGYVYWVLRQHGRYPTYVLFDTWQEAIDEAVRRMNVRTASPPQSEAALISV